MKRYDNLYPCLISDSNLDKAIEVVCRGHRWVGDHRPNKTILWVDSTREERREELRRIIVEGFVPTEPKIKRRYDNNARKWRDIAEPKLWPDQFVHHALIQVLEPIMIRRMDPYCCGSIKGRGTMQGIKAMKKWMSNEYGSRWCLQMDIYHFYEQLQPEVVMDRLRQIIKDKQVLDLCERVMLHGVTIGAYFSQWFANTVLQPLDILIRQCDICHYVRYMDNFTVFAQSKKALKKVRRIADKWLRKHGMRLKGNWQYFMPDIRLPDAFGYRFGRGYTLIRKRRLLNIKRQTRTYHKIKKKKISFKFAASYLSRIGGLKHCNSTNIIRKYLPDRIQKKTKNIIKEHQKKELTSWNTYLEQYAEELKSRKDSKQ